MKKIFTFISILISFTCFSQIKKRPLNQNDYDGWKTLQKNIISNDGKWISYEINPQEGDGVLHIEAFDRSQKIKIDRGYSATFSPDGAFLVTRIKPSFELTRAAKKKKLKPEKMPKDSLLIISLNDGMRKQLADVKNYTLPKLNGDWMGLLSEMKTEKVIAADTARKVKPGKAKSEKPKGDLLTLLNFKTKDTVSFSYVTEFQIADNGNAVLFARDAFNDSSKVRGVFAFIVSSGETILLDTSSTLRQYRNLAVDKAGKQGVWMSSADSVKAEIKKFALTYRQLSAKVKNETLADSNTKAFSENYVLSEFEKPRFSDDGRRLYFSSMPVSLKSSKDTSFLDDELSKMDVWSWTDKKIQPMQQKQAKEEKERSFAAVYDFATKKINQLGSVNINSVKIDEKATHSFLLGTGNSKYQLISSWDPGHLDIYLLNAVTAEKKLIANDINGEPQLSPAGKYVVWFDERDTLWTVYDTKTGKTERLTKGLKVNFYDEEHDTPDLAPPYGAMGWSADDKYFFVYDRYDVWQLDPLLKEKPVMLTNGFGRNEKTQLRYIKTNDEETFLPSFGEILLSGLWETDKQTGILKPAKPGSDPVVLAKGQEFYLNSSVRKAKNTASFLFQKGSYSQANELYSVRADWTNPQRLTNLSAQTDSIKWGSAELVSWLSTQGLKLEGLLFKPEGFDPAKKYPMLVYYYERNAETLFQHRIPAPSRSTINIPYCVSNDYLVFVPDIIYSGGTPGKNAFDCVVPGVTELIRRGFVDEKNIGLQGQSWGGYQTAYLITQTNMFKAAMAGAPVANMTSAYGGIRWGTGMSRMFQYEKTQSRIGGTLWEKPMYFLENSPLFYADRINTPLLMMHNDADGSVPWYQGIEFFTALRRLNKPVWMLVYNDEDHNLTKRPNQKDLGIRMYQFFDHYLKGAPVPSWMSQGRSVLDKERWDMKYK